MPTFKPKLITLVAAFGGGWLFTLLNIPLPFLFGPMAACLILALSGVRLEKVNNVSTAARTILGVAVGASITPAVLEQIPQMLGSILFVPLYIFFIGLIGVPFFRKICKFDWATAYYAAMPGGLQDMILFGKERGGDVRALSLVHATRVLIVVTLVPIILTQYFDVSLDQPIGQPTAEIPISQLVLMAFAGLAGWKIAERLKLFGASITGPLFLSLILALSGVLEYRPPAEAILIAQYFIGIGIGVYYVGITWQELRKIVTAGIAFMVILSLLAMVFALAIAAFNDLPVIEAFLAFAPGGQAEMTVLAIVSGADLGFVVSHHLVRLIVVITGAPIVAKLLNKH